MFAGPLTFCAQCGAVIESDPVGLGDEMFCCLGCVGGGPCICERKDQPQLTLRIGPFVSQGELLRFAARMEQAPGLVHVELIRPDTQDAAFNVIAPSAQVLALAVEAMLDLTVTTQVTETMVIARITSRARSRGAGTGDDLLPARTRFRVFRAAENIATENVAAVPPPPASMPPSKMPQASTVPAPSQRSRRPTPPPASPEHEVAELLANARLATGHVRLPVPPPGRAARVAPVAAPIDTPAAPEPVAEPAREPSVEVAETPPLLVVGGPFNSFAAVNDFQGVVRALRGVTDARIRRLYKGTLQLVVDYEGDVPFTERLLAVTGGACTATEAGGQIDVRVRAPDAFSTPQSRAR